LELAGSIVLEIAAPLTGLRKKGLPNYVRLGDEKIFQNNLSYSVMHRMLEFYQHCFRKTTENNFPLPLQARSYLIVRGIILLQK
jgi:hypothetical protein